MTATTFDSTTHQRLSNIRHPTKKTNLRLYIAREQHQRAKAFDKMGGLNLEVFKVSFMKRLHTPLPSSLFFFPTEIRKREKDDGTKKRLIIRQAF